MGILSGNPQDEPMHYGEVFGVWTALTASKAQLATYQLYENHAGDDDLKAFLHDMIQNVVKPAIEETEALLQKNEVALPPSPPEKAEASREEIPAGARIMDPEISAALTRDIGVGLVADSQMISECVREDIAMMFNQYHTKKVQMGARLLRMNKEKGWLIPPPLHVEKVPQV